MKTKIILGLILLLTSFLFVVFLVNQDKVKYIEKSIETKKLTMPEFRDIYVIFDKVREFEDGSNYILGTLYINTEISSKYVNLSCLELSSNAENFGPPSISHSFASIGIDNLLINDSPFENIQWEVNDDVALFTLSSKKGCLLFAEKKNNIIY